MMFQAPLRTPFQSQFRALMLLLILLPAITNSQQSDATPKAKNQIIYSIMQNTKAYNKKERGSHIAIKITTPKNFGEPIFVEVYNHTSHSLSQIDFNLFLNNKSWFNFEAQITAEQILPHRSAVRQVTTPTKKAAFPAISKISLSDLKIYNVDATELKLKVFVDLLRS